MGKNKNEGNDKIIEMIKNLPGEKLNAILLAIENLDYIEKICKISILKEDEIKEGKKEAMENLDYFMLAVYCIAEILNNRNNETD